MTMPPNTPNLPKSESTRKDFVIHNVSGNVLKSLSPRARDLWLVMRRLADAKTGELRYPASTTGDRYPSGSFITRAKIMREAGMANRKTFNRYLFELCVHGLAHVRQHPLANPEGRGSFSPPEYSVSEKPRPEWVCCAAQCGIPHKKRGPCVDQLPENFSADQFLRSRKKRSANTQNPTGSNGLRGVRLQVFLEGVESGSSSYRQTKTFALQNHSKRKIETDPLEAFFCPCGSVHWFIPGCSEPTCYCFQCGCEFGKPHGCGCEGLAEYPVG